MLQHDIDLIRAKLLEMAALDERALTRAFQAFLGRDRQLAYSVILRDQDVDALETELDRLCVEFIVRHQPAAGHLRFVYSASKIVGELERVGDYAESIARQVLLLSSLPYDVPTDRFSEIANLAIPMLHNAVRAFVDRNADLARTTMASEPRVNQVRDAINAELVEWREQGTLPLEALPPHDHGGAPLRARVGPGDEHLRGGAVLRDRRVPAAPAPGGIPRPVRGRGQRVPEPDGRGDRQPAGREAVLVRQRRHHGGRRRSADGPVPRGQGHRHLAPSLQIRGRGSASSTRCR